MVSWTPFARSIAALPPGLPVIKTILAPFGNLPITYWARAAAPANVIQTKEWNRFTGALDVSIETNDRDSRLEHIINRRRQSPYIIGIQNDAVHTLAHCVSQIARLLTYEIGPAIDRQKPLLLVNRRSKILEEFRRKFSGFSDGDVERLLKQALGCEQVPN